MRELVPGAPADRLVLLDDEPDAAALAHDVAVGMMRQPKRLPARWRRDATGLALLEAIHQHPEHYLHAAERLILERRARAVVASLLPGATLVDLGGDAAANTRLILEALLERDGRVDCVAIDASREALEATARAFLDDYPGLRVVALAADVRAALRHLRRLRLGPRLVTWLGAGVGTMARAEAARVLAALRRTLGPGDALLVGADLRKDARLLERLYADSAGLHALYNRNLLCRINDALGARFDPTRFRHRVAVRARLGRVDQYLVSDRPQLVPIAGLRMTVPLRDGEPIHVESAYTYSRSELYKLAALSGFAVAEHWRDPEGRYALSLFRPRLG